MSMNIIRSPILVDKTCPLCKTYYRYWDSEKLDGTTKLGLWYTCKTKLEGGKVCGSTMLHVNPQTMRSMQAQKTKIDTSTKEEETEK